MLVGTGVVYYAGREEVGAEGYVRLDEGWATVERESGDVLSFPINRVVEVHWSGSPRDPKAVDLT